MNAENIREVNKSYWNTYADLWFGTTALPKLGVHFPTEEDLHLFGDVSGKKMLEICCGSGYFAAYPLELPVGGLGEPDFVMDGIWLLARGMYLVLGVALFICNMKVGDKATRA